MSIKITLAVASFFWRAEWPIKQSSKRLVTTNFLDSLISLLLNVLNHCKMAKPLCLYVSRITRKFRLIQRKKSLLDVSRLFFSIFIGLLNRFVDCNWKQYRKIRTMRNTAFNCYIAVMLINYIFNDSKP